MDLIIANGDVVDGTGRARYKADLGIVGESIVAVAPRLDDPAATRVDARGLVVSPGFIDLHSHSDLCVALPLTRQAALLEGRIRQGITTELLGNCGIGCAPVERATRASIAAMCGFITPARTEWSWESIDSYLGHLERQGVVPNVATLAGHGPIRTAAMGWRADRPSADEQRVMNDMVRAAVEAGAFGISFGLIYPPGLWSDTEELVSAAAAAGRAGGFAAFHQRGSDRETLLPAVREIIEVGRRSRAPVHHSHLETVGPRAWPATPEVLRLEAEAIEDGVDISGDVIPYTAVCTTMLALFPPWSLEGGLEAFLDRLRDPGSRGRMRGEIATTRAAWPLWESRGAFAMNIAGECGWDRIRVAHVGGAANKTHEHETIAQLGARRGLDPFEALCELLLEEEGVATQLIFGISGDDRTDEDLLVFLRCARLAFVTDAWEIGTGFPHPGAYGAFPRVLGHYVRRRNVLSLEEAVSRMTSVPARRLGLTDRGRIAEGAKADLVVFDPGTVDERATFREPRRHAAGISEVLINGRRVVAEGRYAPEAAGRVLRRGR